MLHGGGLAAGADNCQDAKKVRPAMQQQQQIQPKDDSKKD